MRPVDIHACLASRGPSVYFIYFVYSELSYARVEYLSRGGSVRFTRLNFKVSSTALSLTSCGLTHFSDKIQIVGTIGTIFD